jgi:FixJ family two-component response regulator
MPVESRLHDRAGPKLIAVVDDDAGILKSTGRALKGHGFEILLFTSAEAFQAGAGRSDLNCLVLDIQLGGMSGIELRRALSQSGSAVPVVFITANDKEATRRAAIEAGCVTYLLKPFTTRELLEAVDKAVGTEGSPANH